MQKMAMSWLVYRLTNSEFLLGLVAFLSLFPIFALTPLVGVLADRVNRHHALVMTQTCAMIQAFILSFLVLSGLVHISHIMILATFSGIIDAFDVTIRQSFTVQMIERKEDLGNAIALNSAMFNGARLVGPALAGLLISLVGEGLCFLGNGLSYLAVIAALLMMKISPADGNGVHKKIVQELKEGIKYSLNFMPIRSVLTLLALAGITGLPYMVLMPVFAKQVLHGGADTLGFLMGSAGCGALIGAIFLASRPSVAGLETVVAFMSGLFGLGLVGFSQSSAQWLSMLLLMFTGFTMLVFLSSSNAILQTIVDEDKRGRVISFYVMCVLGVAPFGSLLAGAAADWLGAPETVFFGGLCCLAGTLFFSLKLRTIKKIIRPIYIEKGIITEAAPGLEAPANLPKL